MNKMLKKEITIILPFVKMFWKELTFKEIKKMTGKKSESYIYGSLKKFVASNILKEKKIGKSVLYRININSLKTQCYLGFISEYTTWNSNIPHRDLESLLNKMPTKYYTAIITGSYAKGTQKKESDIDLVIIVDDSIRPKRIYAELSHYCEMNIPPIHLYVFTKSEFISMLINTEANYGKEIVKSNLLLFGAQNYYSIVAAALQNGFTGEDIS